jgi:hypothetical protein
MPPRLNGSQKAIAVLKVRPGVGEHCIATGQFAVIKHDNAGSSCLRGFEPSRVTTISKHVVTYRPRGLSRLVPSIGCGTVTGGQCKGRSRGGSGPSPISISESCRDTPRKPGNCRNDRPRFGDATSVNAGVARNRNHSMTSYPKTSGVESDDPYGVLVLALKQGVAPRRKCG